jgi:hypothetical protein
MANPDGITPEALSQYAEILKLSYTNLIVCRALYTAAELRIPDLLVACNSDIGIRFMYHEACLKESFA